MISLSHCEDWVSLKSEKESILSANSASRMVDIKK